MTIPTAEVQKLEASAEVVLFELDITPIGGSVLRFHGYTQVGVITWQGNEFSPWPIDATGFARTSSGSLPTPKLTVGNVDGSISALCTYFDDIVGAKLTKFTTFGKYLDAVNFPGGNPTADPTQEFPPDVWYIEQKTSETNETVEFQLASALDCMGTLLPRRQIVANVCAWLSTGGYRGPYCGYTGAAKFDKDGNAVTDSSQDRCGGKISDCKLRFGTGNPINFGGFPGAGLT